MGACDERGFVPSSGNSTIFSLCISSFTSALKGEFWKEGGRKMEIETSQEDMTIDFHLPKSNYC